MKRSFLDALAHRRSYYALKPESPVSDKEIEELVKTVLNIVPSAFNSQSARIVILLGDNHKKLWEIVKSTLSKKTSPEQFEKTRTKIEDSFESGYGTMLFFEDQDVVKELQKSFPTYADNFPGWSLQASGMHQLAVWTRLEDLGFGATLQHYNPLIDEEVAHTWDLPKSWKLISQMPFGIPAAEPGEKEMQETDKRMRVFK